MLLLPNLRGEGLLPVFRDFILSRSALWWSLVVVMPSLVAVRRGSGKAGTEVRPPSKNATAASREGGNERAGAHWEYVSSVQPSLAGAESLLQQSIYLSDRTSARSAFFPLYSPLHPSLSTPCSQVRIDCE